MAAVLVNVPPAMGGALVVGIVVLVSTFMSVEAGIYLLFFAMLMNKVFQRAMLLFRETEEPLYRGLAVGLMCGLIGLLVYGLGTITFIILRIMEPFWLVSALVVTAYKIEMEERKAAVKAAAEAGAVEIEIEEAV
jgi:hypothetical protein